MIFTAGGRFRSDALDGNSLRVRCERLQVIRVGRENRSARLSHGDDQRVDCGTTSSPSAQESGAPGQAFGDPFHDVAGLEQLVLGSVTARMSLKTLYENHRGDRGRPKPLFSQCDDQRHRGSRTLGKPADGSGIQNQQALANLAGGALGDSLGKTLCAGSLARPGFPDLGNYGGSVPIGL